jgi:HPr Serine kinase C-terminal domain
VTRLHIIDRAALPLHAYLRIAGAHCALATNCEEILAATSRWRCEGRPRTDRTFDLNVVVDPSLPAHRDLKTHTHFRGLHHLVFATIGSHEVFVFDLLRRSVAGAVSKASAADPGLWNSHWLPITIGVMGTTVGVVPLHSASLDRNGQSVLLAGVSGAGKSTLSVALAQRGFSLISDDWTYISREENKLIAHGLGAPVKLLPDAVRHFPELRGRTPITWFNGELAFELTPDEICHAPSKLASRPRWLFFLERDPQPGCSFFPVAASEVRNYFEGSAERLPDQLPSAKAARSATIEAIANCPSWRVISGESPQATADAIARFCGRN